MIKFLKEIAIHSLRIIYSLINYCVSNKKDIQNKKLEGRKRKLNLGSIIINRKNILLCKTKQRLF